MRADFEVFLRDRVAARFKPLGPVVDASIAAAEARLGVRLPDSHKLLLRTLGAGVFGDPEAAIRDFEGRPGIVDDTITSPEDIHALDLGGGAGERFVVLVRNVGGTGDLIAFAPRDPEIDGERPVYLMTHDPPGHARLAGSFEDYVRGRYDDLALDRSGDEHSYHAALQQIEKDWETANPPTPMKALGCIVPLLALGFGPTLLLGSLRRSSVPVWLIAGAWPIGVTGFGYAMLHAMGEQRNRRITAALIGYLLASIGLVALLASRARP